MSNAQPEPAGVDEQQVITDQPELAASQTDREQRQAVSEYSKKVSGKSIMSVKVYSPFHDYYDGTAFSLTAQSATGVFDILPRHHNFISLLVACDMIIRSVSEGDHRITISGGLIHVKANQVIVFLDI